MKPSLTPQVPGSAYNALVRKAYFKVLKETKNLLATFEQEPLRYVLVRQDKQPTINGTIVHELVNPLVYLRLECFADNRLGIHFGWELSPTFGEYYHITSRVIRVLYKYTMADTGPINIEDCIKTDWVINECSELYEYVEERGCKHHSFALIQHKPKAEKRKLRKVA